MRGVSLVALLLVVGVVTAHAAPPASAARATRYLLFDVNAVEGFNLRRDALVRAALLVRRLGPNWTLVLPPLPRMPHWKGEAPQAGLSWGTFIDLAALARAVPVVDYAEWSRAHGATVDEAIWVAAGEPDPGHPDHFTVEDVDCASQHEASFVPASEGTGHVRRAPAGSALVRAVHLRCVRAFAPFSALTAPLRDGGAQSVFVDRFERLFWDESWDSPEYWEVRRHIVFARPLVQAAERWTARTFHGAPYLSVHLRRGDFVSSGRKVPSIDDVIVQLRRLRDESGLRAVFIATDASEAEWKAISAALPAARYAPEPAIARLDGAVAIVDQVIAARGTRFVGTAGSTFSTVIMEERALAGHPPAATFRVLCPGARALDGTTAYTCEQPAPRFPDRSKQR